MIYMQHALVSFPDPLYDEVCVCGGGGGGGGTREKEGLGDYPIRMCPEGMLWLRNN